MSAPVEISATVNGQRVNLDTSFQLEIACGVDQKQVVKFVVVNRSKERLIFSSYGHGYKKLRTVQLSLRDKYQVGDGVARVLQPGESCWVTADIVPKGHCGVRIPINFNITQVDGHKLKIIRELIIDCVAQQSRGMFDQLAPDMQYEADDDDDNNEYRDLEIVEFPGYPSTNVLEFSLELSQYHVDDYVLELVCAPNGPERLDRIRETLNIRNHSFDNYAEFFGHLLDLEEIQHWKDIGHYTLKCSNVYKDRQPDWCGNTRFRLQVPGLAERRPSILRGDRLYVMPVPPDGFKYEGCVDSVSQNNAYMVFSPRFEEDIIDVEGLKFRIEFTIDRLSLRLMHRAVEIIKASAQFEDILFPTSTLHFRPSRNVDQMQLELFEGRIEDNPEQLQAVKHIVAGTSKPAPYLIYGPPGTGKTFTLVEAIKQVCKMSPKSKILVCAPQNDAADIIAERLLDHVNPSSIIRLNAVSRSYDSLSDAMKGISNYNVQKDKVYYPAKADLARKQIVVSTLVTSGRMVSAELTNHFTHIFIDEAGHATEPETVIPLGLWMSENIKGQLVLAGDPKQLGAIIRSDLASAHGLGKSLLERLMAISDGPYARGGSEHPSYNKNFVTKLLRNFRSHPEILEVPNQRFYEFELQPCANRQEREKYCGWQHLPIFSLDRWESSQIGFPLIFRQVEGREEQELSSPSWFNRYEVLVVAEYVELLLLSNNPSINALDIGIISPYIQQVRKIRQALRSISSLQDRHIDVRDIKVGSVERFQGAEKEVIIISTVRSQPAKLAHDKKFNLGFVSNHKRFNVAVTRAKSLLVVIGNPEVLCTDENWRRLVQHIVHGGGYMGDELSEELLRIENDEVTEEMEQLNVNDLNAGTTGKSNYLLHQDDEYVGKE